MNDIVRDVRASLGSDYQWLDKPTQKTKTMSDSKVKVTAKDGHVIVKSKKNEDYGHIRVEQVRMVVDDTTGFAKMKPISALIPGTIKDLKGFGWSEGDEVDGMIRIVEQMKPFNKKDPDRDLKIAGKTGIVCQKDGEPIYRKHFFTLNMNLGDTLEAHNNQEEISEAHAALKEAEGEGSAIKPNEDFNL
jgi:hypothetical protein